MISFIYFDVGGVVIKDFAAMPEKWENVAAELGMPNKGRDLAKLWKEQELETNTGTDADNLLPLIAKKFNVNIPRSFSLFKALVERYEANKSIWPVVEFAQRNFRTGLLTNMAPGMLDAIYAKGIMPKSAWKVLVDSSLEGFAKPEHKIYTIAENKAEVSPDKILFIDNLPENLEPARGLGWQLFHYDPADVKKSSQALSAFLKEIATPNSLDKSL